MMIGFAETELVFSSHGHTFNFVVRGKKLEYYM